MARIVKVPSSENLAPEVLGLLGPEEELVGDFRANHFAVNHAPRRMRGPATEPVLRGKRGIVCLEPARPMSFLLQYLFWRIWYF